MGLAGRVEKENRVSRWRREGAALAEAIEPYYKAFIADPSHHWSGINALTLHILSRHLGGESNPVVIDNLIGGVCWASLTAQQRNRKDYWARTSYAELCLLVNAPDSVRKEYSTTIAATNRDWFALDSTRRTRKASRQRGSPQRSMPSEPVPAISP